MTKNKFWNINFVFLMDFYWNSFTITPNFNLVKSLININFSYKFTFDSVLIFLSLKIICCVYNYFIKYFIKPRDVFFFFEFKIFLRGVWTNPKLLICKSILPTYLSGLFKYALIMLTFSILPQ